MRSFLLLAITAGVAALAFATSQDKASPKTLLVDDYSASATKRVAELKSAKTKEDADKAAKGFSASTDDVFRRLESDKLIDDKLEAYRAYWKALGPKLEKAPQNKAVLAAVEAFPDDLLAAAKGNKCTVTVSASKGDGAEITYIKFVDDGKAKDSHFGVTLVTKEVEAAEYVFRSHRKGAQTGESKVKCTDTKKPVAVSVQEK